MNKHQQIRREKHQIHQFNKRLRQTAARFFRHLVALFIFRLLIVWRIRFDEVSSAPVIIFLLEQP